MRPAGERGVLARKVGADPGADGGNVVAETAENSGEEGVVLHAVAAAAGGAGDDFVEEVVGVERHSAVRGVVQVEVFEGDVAQLVPNEE